MSDKYVMKKNSGNLFTEKNVTVPRKGRININGEEKYCGILKYTGDGNTKDKYELVVSMGLLHFNAPEDKKKEGTPDIGGKITFDGDIYKFGGWLSQTAQGIDYTSVKLTPCDEDGNPIYEKKPEVTETPNDEDIPF